MKKTLQPLLHSFEKRWGESVINDQCPGPRRQTEEHRIDFYPKKKKFAVILRKGGENGRVGQLGVGLATVVVFKLLFCGLESTHFPEVSNFPCWKRACDGSKTAFKPCNLVFFLFLLQNIHRSRNGF